MRNYKKRGWKNRKKESLLINVTVSLKNKEVF